jgi:predicted kinase
MLQSARLLLAEGRSVILDGTWRDLRHREEAREVARQEHSPTVELVCTAPTDEAMTRIANRSASTSDATPRIASAMARDDHSWVGAHYVDTTQPLSDTVAEAQEVCCLAI